MLVGAWLAALAIGITLGLLGGGGSVLTVPVFVYLLDIDARSAVAMSMPVVGIASLVGAYGHWKSGNVAWRQAVSFGVMAMAGAYAGARLAVFITGAQQLVLLALVMAASALSMLRPRPADQHEPTADDAPETMTHFRPAVVAAALAVGVLTGLVGIGGGFLVVPALVVLSRVPMHRAIGTSLVVIAMNATSGVLGYIGRTPIDWSMVAWFTAISSGGILLGARIGSRVPAAHLRRGFALMLLALAAFLVWQNRVAAIG
jgi:uncharacterized membrane protein YfcA